jgi:hypothetical protein
MTALEFELTFRTDELRNLDLPVEIRKPNMVLVKRALASEKVELEPGTYYVGIKMPAGQESWSKVKVDDEDAHQKVRLGPEPGASPASEVEELGHYFAPAYVPPPVEGLTYLALMVAAAVGLLAGAALGYGFTETYVKTFAAAAAAVGAGLSMLLLSKVLRPGYTAVQRRMREARLRNFRGNVLLGDYTAEGEWSRDAETLTKTDDLVEIAFKGENRSQIVQLIQTDEPAVNVVLPAWREHGCRLVLKKQPDARYTLEVHLHHAEAELLLRYCEQGRWQLAAGVSESPAVSAEALLKVKREQPIAAAVGAYALLRLGELERLHDWSENLMNWFEWLPDGAAVRGEHLARTGEHKKALRAFCELVRRGLPYFSDGLSYAVDRLRLYRGIGEKHFDAAEMKECEEALALLEPFSLYTDFSKALTTFTGLKPGSPDAQPVAGKLAPHGGTDVTELMRLASAGEGNTTTEPRPAAGAGAYSALHLH